MTTYQETSSKVRSFFHKGASSFDSIYSGKTTPVMRVMNKILRKDMYTRYDMTIAGCGDVKGKRLLDVGCGSGRYCLELAKRGGQCVGIDFAQNMLDLANSLAKEQGVADKCEFKLIDYMDYQPAEPFDISFAIGYFDYISNPVEHLQKLRRDTKEKLMTIWPVSGTLRAAIREKRLTAGDCPVYFYSAEEVTKLMNQGGWDVQDIVRIGEIWFVTSVPAK